jgi:hypothetical protein
MGYRDAVPRKKRLWFVTMVYSVVIDDEVQSAHVKAWIWALEADEAIELVREGRRLTVDSVWSSQAVCGEDFAEREAKGET